MAELLSSITSALKDGVYKTALTYPGYRAIAFHKAVLEYDLDEMKKLLKEYPSLIDSIVKESDGENTPLTNAIKAKRIDAARFLIVAKANVNLIVGSEENSPLNLAAIHCPELIPMLLKNGAKIETRKFILGKTSFRESTPLMESIKGRNISSVRTILAARTDVDEINHEGQRALMFALRLDLEEAAILVPMLLRAGSKPDRDDCFGSDSPLQLAMQPLRYSLAKMLLDAGADVSSGQCLFMSAKQGVTGILPELLWRGARNAQDIQDTAERYNHNNFSILLRILPNLNWFNRDLFQSLVNRCELEYLKRVPADHFLKTQDKKILEESVNTVVDAAAPMIFKKYEIELQSVAKTTGIPMLDIQAALIFVLKDSIINYYLSPKEPYEFGISCIDLLGLNVELSKTFHSFPTSLISIIFKYLQDISPGSSFADETENEFSEKGLRITANHILNKRFECAISLLKKTDPEPGIQKLEREPRKIRDEKEKAEYLESEKWLDINRYAADRRPLLTAFLSLQQDSMEIADTEKPPIVKCFLPEQLR